MPELLTPCYGDGMNPGTPDYPNHADRENLDPSKNYTYQFMQTLFQELKDLFHDEFLHLGMDEVCLFSFMISLQINRYTYTSFLQLVFR